MRDCQLTETPAGRLLDLTAQQIGLRLTGRGQRLAVAETSAGGLIGTILARQSGAERWFAGSIVAYDRSVQTGLLDLTGDLIGSAGIVSPEVASFLARSVAVRFATEWGIGETGIAGPQTGRRSSKPAGLGYFAVSENGLTRSVEIRTGHDRRIDNKVAFAAAALELLLRCLESA